MMIVGKEKIMMDMVYLVFYNMEKSLKKRDVIQLIFKFLSLKI